MSNEWINPHSRTRGRSWDNARHGWPTDQSGVIVRCGRHRILDAILDPADPDQVLLSSPGLPDGGVSRSVRERDVRVGCALHESHVLGIDLILKQIELAATRDGRRHVTLDRVERPVG